MLSVLASAVVIAGCVAGIVGIAMAIRHRAGEDVSKWLAAGLALLAVGTLLMTVA